LTSKLVAFSPYGQNYYRTLTGNHIHSIEYVPLSMTLSDLGLDFKVVIFSQHWMSQKRHEIEPWLP